MKRDLPVCRRILEAVEERAAFRVPQPVDLNGVDPDVVEYNTLKLWEAGYIETATTDESGGVRWPLYLTWAGHEKLVSLRREIPDSRWRG